jgi:hypothetical protein
MRYWLRWRDGFEVELSQAEAFLLAGDRYYIRYSYRDGLNVYYTNERDGR